MSQNIESRPVMAPPAVASASDAPVPDAPSRYRLPALGLSSKLLLLTLLFVMIAEVLIFLPSVTNFRINWLMDRLTAAKLAALAAEASPTGDIPPALRGELLRAARVKAIAIKRHGERRLVLEDEMPSTVDETFDLGAVRQPGLTFSQRVGVFGDAIALLFGPGTRTIRVLGRPVDASEDVVDIVLPEAPLKAAMVQFGLNILLLSIIISIITAALVYMALNMLLVRPILRIAGNMLRFSKNPEDRSRIIQATDRRDEIGTAERELAHMQSELSQLLAQKNRLAALGLAVSKINHDLRNLLANTQLLSDRLASSPDPTVQRFAPKLIASLDRAIAFCNDTLRFGRAAERAPRRDMLDLAALVDEVGDGIGLPREGAIDWQTGIARGLEVDADREHLFRVLTNLVRNAVQALETQAPGAKGVVVIEAERRGGLVAIRVSDDGPGVPQKAREHLFQAFQGSARKGGTGLGLAIAQELVAAHGGSIRLLDRPRGATFELVIPDRSDA